MTSLPIYNTEGREVGKIELNPEIFDGTINQNVLQQTAVMYQTNQRKGLASTKTRGEVSGGGRKPWRQKGTGRARHGSIRSPLWSKGGVVFGPHRRNYHYSLPGKIKSLALKSSLNAKLNEGCILVLDAIDITQSKTKEFIAILSKLQPLLPSSKRGQSLLLLLDKIDEKLKLATNNINFLDINLAKDANAMGILKSRHLVVTRKALESLTDRIKKGLDGSRKSKG